nr:zinc finger BED domain-containing protein RICESLEEPER 2-like [Ipomoea batatas]
MLIDYEGKLRAKKIDHNRVRELTSMAIIYHDLPYSWVEYTWVRELHKYLKGDYKFLSRNTTAADVYMFYEREKDKLNNVLLKVPSRICLTSDLWTACTVEGYICLTAHYIDNDWKLNSKILSFCAMPPPHTGPNDSMQNILKEQLCLQNDLLCNGEFFHVRCSAHILNLIVQDGLKVIGDSFYKVRESVRWNSASKMLDTAIKYRRAFSSLQLLDTNYKHCPSQEEWARVEKIFWKIEYLLTMNMKSGDSVIKNMACKMKIKFDKYWEQYSVILAMGVVLDPRMKFKLLEFCYKKLDGSTYEEKLDIVKNKLYMLFKAYKATSWTATTSSTASTSRCENVVAMEASDDFDDEFLDYCVQDNMQNGKSALDVYLDEPQMDMKSYASLDILNIWKDNKHRFGELSLMACDVLNIPITTVASESSFSIGGRVLNKYRNSLLPSNVKALICTRNWLSGFELDDKGDDGDVEDLPVRVPTESSEA